MDDLRVRIALTEKEILKSVQYVRSKVYGRTTLAHSMIVIIAIVGLNFIYFFLIEPHLPSTFSPLLQAVIYLWSLSFALYLAYLLIQHVKPMVISHPDGTLQRMKEVRIDERGMHHTSREDAGFSSWRSILDIDITDDSLLCYIDKSNFLIIPKRCFNTPEEADQFIAQAQAFWSAAKGTPTGSEPAVSPWAQAMPHPPLTTPDMGEPPSNSAAHSPTKAQAHWYGQNLMYGLKMAFFMSTSQRVFASWHAFFAAMVTIVLSQVLMELVVVGKGGQLAYGWYAYALSLLSITLISAYIISSYAHQGKRTLGIATAFLNSYYFVFIPYALLHLTYGNDLYEGKIYEYLQYLIPIWAFLVMFRIVNQHLHDEELIKPIVSGFVAICAICFLNTQIYFNSIYEEPYEQTEESLTALDMLTSEELFSMQPVLRQKSLDKIQASKPGKTDIYALTFGSYAPQDVFMRDVNYVGERLHERLGITNIIRMLNNKTTINDISLANITNLQAYLETLSKKFMQPKEDIALIFLTSHGGRDVGLSARLSYGDFSLLAISPEKLAAALKNSGIQNKIIVISACHSGTFIPHLQDEHTMIITAAAADRASFGCSDNNPLTYFTEAYFKNGLASTTDLDKAFEIAKAVVKQREALEGVTKHSNPQIFIGSKIKDILRKYKGTKLVIDE